MGEIPAPSTNNQQNFQTMKQTICGGCITVAAIALMIWGIRVIGFNDGAVDFMIVFIMCCGWLALAGLIAIFEATGISDIIRKIFIGEEDEDDE